MELEKLFLRLHGAERAYLSNEDLYLNGESWFDTFVHAFVAAKVHVQWDYEHLNQMENQHHFCVALSMTNPQWQLLTLFSEMADMFDNHLLRLTLKDMYAFTRQVPIVDTSLPFDAQPTQTEFVLVLPNVTTNAIHMMRHCLPTSWQSDMGRTERLEQMS